MKEYSTAATFKDNPLFRELISLGLPPEDFAIFGSGPMAAHGLKDFSHDIDIIARGKAWEKAKELGTPEETRMKFGDVVTLFNGDIEIYNGWFPKEMWNIDDLIDRAEYVEGVKFVTLEDLVKWKKVRQREGDEEDIKKIQEFLRLNK